MNLNIKLSVLQFLQFFVWGTWYVTAGTYFIKTLNFSGTQVASIYASFAIAATITPIFLGSLADKYFSVEKLLAILHIIGAGLLFCISLTDSYPIIYALVFTYVMCYVPTVGLSSSLCFHHIKDAKADYPKIRVWGTIGWIVAGLLVGYLMIEDQSTTFLISSVVSLAFGVYCLFLPHTPPLIGENLTFIQALKDDEMKAILKNPNLRVLIISIALIAIPLSYYYSFVNPFLNEMGVMNAAGKMTIGQGMEILVMLLLPWFFKKVRFKTIIFIGLLLWGVRYGLFILGSQWSMEWLFIIALAIHGFAFVFAMLSVQIYFDTVIPAKLRSTAQGLFSVITMGFMGLVGTIISGAFFDYYTSSEGVHNWEMFWVFPTVCGILVALYFFVFFKAKDKVG